METQHLANVQNQVSYTKHRWKCLPGRLCGIPTTDRLPERHEAHRSCCTSLDLIFQGLHRVCFHDCPCCLCLHLHLLAKNIANAGLCRWLHTSLNAAEDVATHEVQVHEG